MKEVREAISCLKLNANDFFNWLRLALAIAISPWRDVAGVVQTEPGSEPIIWVYVDDQESSA